MLGNQPWVVLGMHRSGTSAVSGLLNQLGAYFGPAHKFFKADANNETGYFELEDLTAIHHEALAAFQLRPWSVESMPENWRERPLAGPIINELVHYFSSNFAGQQEWGFKQPMTTLLLPLYAEVFKRLDVQPKFVVCVRDPLETLESERSWSYRDNARLLAPLGPRALAVWLRYTLGALMECPEPDTSVIVYEELLNDPANAVDLLIKQRPDWNPSSERVKAASNHVKPVLRHHQSDKDALQNWPSLISRAYDFTKQPIDDRDIAALWAEFDRWRAMFRPLAPSAGILALFYRGSSGIKSFEQRFHPESEWLTLRLEVDAPPRTRLVGSLYNQPCRVWFRRCEWVGNGDAAVTPGPTTMAYEVGPFKGMDFGPASHQFSVECPGGPGPYVLEMEILLETSPEISNHFSERLLRSIENPGR